MTWNLLREPALVVAGVLAPTVQTALLIWGGLSDEAQSLWNAATVALAGLLVAVLSARERLAPAIVGVATAGLALATYYGWHLNATQQTAVISTVTLLAAAFLRTQVTAAVGPDGQRVPHTAPTK